MTAIEQLAANVAECANRHEASAKVVVAELLKALTRTDSEKLRKKIRYI